MRKGSSAIRTPTFWRTRPLTPFSARRRSGTSVLSSLILTRSIGAQTASGCSRRSRTASGQAGYAVSNLDATVLAQAPKLAPYVQQMRERLAAACGVEPGQVSVKATTEEGLGFTGTGEGIAAHAVCLLEPLPLGDDSDPDEMV